jgi:SAM-dependent methyltransferase
VEHFVKFEEQSYCQTTFPANCFDVIWAAESICHSPNKKAFFEEAFRVLRRGGRLGIEDYITARPARSQAEERLMRSWLTGWAIPGLPSHDEMVSMVASTGFDEIELVDVSANTERSMQRLHRMAARSWPLALTLRAFGFISDGKLANVRAARDQYDAFRSGLWRVVILTATRPTV